MMHLVRKPSAEMILFFERRTNEHIGRVRRCLNLLAPINESGNELVERGMIHDASKFGEIERIPYIWLTEYHRCRRSGEPFEYPVGIEVVVKHAVKNHVTTNRHHTQFHSNPNDMSDVDLIEMVCDWTAMAQEFNQEDTSARRWADKTIGRRFVFNAEKTRFIYRIIEELERLT